MNNIKISHKNGEITHEFFYNEKDIKKEMVTFERVGSRTGKRSPCFCGSSNCWNDEYKVYSTQDRIFYIKCPVCEEKIIITIEPYVSKPIYLRNEFSNNPYVYIDENGNWGDYAGGGWKGKSRFE